MIDQINNETDNELTDKQQIALVALVSEPTVRDAAPVCGLSEATLFRYRRDPAFREAYREARRDALAAARRSLEDLAETASQTLKAVMQDPKAPASARVAAARSVWNLIGKQYDEAEVEDLLDQIREADTDA